MTARHQHYVPQWYLANWADENGRVAFTRDGQVRGPTNPRNILGRRDFYEAPALTIYDIAFLASFVTNFVRSEHARPMAETILEDALYHSTLKTISQSSPNLSEQEKDQLQRALKTHEERRLAVSEGRAKSVVDRLRQGDVDALLQSKDALEFFVFLGDLRFRGPDARGTASRLAALTDGGAAVLARLLAANMSCVHFFERLNRPVTILKNEERRRFVTSDQPVVNILAPRGVRLPDDNEYAVYFPLSPARALIVPPREYRFVTDTATEDLVKSLNAWTASNSGETLVARRCGELLALLEDADEEPPMCRWFKPYATTDTLP